MTQDMMEMSNDHEMHSHCPMMMQGKHFHPQCDMEPLENMPSAHLMNCSGCPMMHMHKCQEPSMNYMMDPDNALMHQPLMPPAMPQMMANLENENYGEDENLEFPNSDYYRQGQQTYIRMLHASPDAPNVDVYINDRPVARNLAYRNFTPYFSLPAGLYDIRVFRTGTTTNPVVSTQFQVPARSIYTLAITGMLKNIGLQPILEPVLPYTPGTSLVRFIHLSPNTPPVDITLPNGQRLFKDVEYKEVTEYIPVRPGTYTIQARPTGTEKIALYVPNIRILPNKIYSVYAIGMLDGKPPLQVLIPLDGSTYLKFS